MPPVTSVSNVTAEATRKSRRRLGAAVLVLAVTLLAHGESFAQEEYEPEEHEDELVEGVFGREEEPEDDPEGLFDAELGEGLDEARRAVAEVYDDAVATDIAVYLCAPPSALEACRESTVIDAWDAFLEGIYDEGKSASQVAEELQGGFDPYLAYGIAVYWCSPEPSDGCAGDPITQAWSRFDSLLDDNNPADAIAEISASAGPLVAQLIAASECGESTCFADLFEEAKFEDLLEFAERQPEVKQRPDPVQLFLPGKPPKPRNICENPLIRARQPKRCRKPGSAAGPP